MIQEQTGHRSLEALRLYKGSTEQQNRAASKILATNTGLDYKKAIHPLSAPEMRPSTDITTGSSSSRGSSIGLNIGLMTGCKINISYGNPPISSQPPTTEAAVPELSAMEIEELELFSDFSRTVLPVLPCTCYHMYICI